MGLADALYLGGGGPRRAPLICDTPNLNSRRIEEALAKGQGSGVGPIED